MDNAKKPTAPEYIRNAVAKGYTWECSCGEIYRTEMAARTCRKCRDYLNEYSAPVNLTEAYDL
jgi:hypothetical protein